MPTRLRYLRSLLIVLSGIIGALQLAVATEPVCSAVDIHPAFPPVNATPAVEVFDADNAAPPSGADCFAHRNKGATWITVASAIQTPLSPDAIIQRFGAISALQTVQYWSTADQAWRPLVSAAFAVSSTDSDQPRADYSSAELVGSPRFYRVTDTRTQQPINYSLEEHPAAHGQIFAETTNIDPISKWGITLYSRDGLHTLYFLNERSPGIWSYYSITRVVPATFLARGHEKSYVNRAIALYRHYLQLPTTADPPAAR
jgi:hypothetical protein